MLPTYSHQGRPVTDLAAKLADSALEVFAKAGSRRDSVEMELQLWRTLTSELEREFSAVRLGRRSSEPQRQQMLAG